MTIPRAPRSLRSPHSARTRTSHVRHCSVAPHKAMNVGEWALIDRHMWLRAAKRLAGYISPLDNFGSDNVDYAVRNIDYVVRKRHDGSRIRVIWQSLPWRSNG
jgi:hypothetical protein